MHQATCQQLFIRSSIAILITSAMLFLTIAPFHAQSVEATPEEAVDDIRFGLLPIGDHSDPYFADVIVRPGETVALEVAVVNVGSVSVDLRLFTSNAHNAENGGFQAGRSDEEPVGPTLWLDLPETLIQTTPGEQVPVAFSVTVPENTPPGQYISALVVETTETVPIQGTDLFDQVIRYSMSVGILVPGELSHEFEFGDPVFDDGALRIPVFNTGNYLVRPEGQLILSDDTGESILTQPLQLGSVYGGNEVDILVHVPDQIPSGEYLLNLTLEDPDSGASAQLSEAEFSIPEPEDPTGVYLREHSIEPNAEPIVFADVSVMVDNGGQQLNSVDVNLIVSRDGEVTDEFPLAVNQTFVNGENVLTARYIPAEMWEPGTYTFFIEVRAVDPASGQEIELLNEELDAEIVVP